MHLPRLSLSVLALLLSASCLAALDVVTVTATVPTVEEDSGKTARFTLVRNGSTGPLSVIVQLGGAYEEAPADQYEARWGLSNTTWDAAVANVLDDGLLDDQTVTFPDGVSSLDVLIKPNVDQKVEGEKRVTLTIQRRSDYTSGAPFQAVARIADDDLSVYWEMVKSDPGEWLKDAWQEEAVFRIDSSDNDPITGLRGVGYEALFQVLDTEDGLPTATIGTDYILTIMYRHDREGFTFQDLRSTNQEIDDGVKTVGQRAEGATRVFVTDTSMFTPGDVIQFGDDAEHWYYITVIDDDEVDLDRPLEVAVSGDVLVRNNLSTTITTEGDIQGLIVSPGYWIEICVTPLYDGTPEGAEPVALRLGDKNDYAIADPTKAVVFIGDDDTVVNIDWVSNASRPSTAGQVDVVLFSAVERPVRVPYVATGNHNGVDAAALLGFIVIPPGQTRAGIPVVPQPGGDDTEITITLLDAADYILYGSGEDEAQPSATVSIAQSKGEVSFSVDQSSISEGASDSTSLTVTLTRDPAQSGAVAVQYQILSTSSAALASDYDISPTGSVTIAASDTSATITITPINDDVVETPETIRIQLLPGSGYSLGPDTAGVVTITDDEPTASITAVRSAEEGGQTGIFRVSLATPAPVTGVTVKLAVDEASTAASGADFSDDLPTEVLITSGNTTYDIAVTAAADDGIAETTKTLILTVVADATYSIDAGSATISILDAGAADNGGDGGRPASGSSGGSACGAGGLAALVGLGLIGLGLRRRRR
jgi:hypothetical protein